MGGEFEAAWTTRDDEHFQRSKVALATATYIAHHSATYDTCINTDASDKAGGAVLEKRLHGVWTPISFFLTQTSRSRDYILHRWQRATDDVLGGEKLRYFIEWRRVTLCTDLLPPATTSLFRFRVHHRNTLRSRRRQCSCWCTDQSTYTTESRHIANIESIFTGVIDYVDMAKQQTVDCGVQRLIADTYSSLKIVWCKLPDTHEQLIVDVSTGQTRPLLPGARISTMS